MTTRFLFTLILFSFFTHQFCTAQASKVALIVAIGDYAKVGEFPQVTETTRSWNAISSKNDVPVVQKALINQGFKNENISLLQDAQATKNGIVNAIRNSLINKVKPGDIAVLHYSGHGQQIKDDNGDELDGFDEALVPYDAAINFQEKVYEGENHLRDDEIEKLVDELRDKLGPKGHLLMVLDACHSGTATRGVAISRGTPQKLAPPGFEGTGKSDEITWSNPSRSANSKATFTVFSGSSANQPNFEYTEQNMGSLTYAFYTALTTSAETGTYQGLYEQVRNTMASIVPRQMPQVEGSINAKVLNGEIVAPKKYQAVHKVIDEKKLVISGGKLTSLFEGSTVAFYPMDKDTAGLKPLALGKVVDSGELESTVELDRPCEKEAIAKAWGYIQNRSLGEVKIKVKLDINRNEAFKKSLKNHLDTLGLIELVNKNADLLIEVNSEFTKSRGNNALQIISGQDIQVFETLLTENDLLGDVKKVERALISFVQANLLRELNVVSSDKMTVNLEIIPVTVQGEDEKKKVKDKLDINTFMKDGNIHLPDGQHIVLKLTNTSSTDFYFTMFDVMPDNSVGPVFPIEGRKPEEYILKAGQSSELLTERSIFEVGRPYGLDVFKIILTKQPIDMSNLITTRGVSTRGNKKARPLETLLSNSFQDNLSATRGAKHVGNPAEVTIQSFPYYIVSPKEIK